MPAETVVTKHYEVSKTTSAYSENGEVYTDGKYCGFAYYSWTQWVNPLNPSVLRIYGVERVEELDREKLFKILLNDINPQEDLTLNGGVRIREVTTTVVTQNDEEPTGNFVIQDSKRVEAFVIYEDFVTKERAKEKETAWEAELALQEAYRARSAEEQRQQDEAASKTEDEQSLLKRLFTFSR